MNTKAPKTISNPLAKVINISLWDMKFFTNLNSNLHRKGSE